MIGIVDYGLGNVQAFVNIYKRLNIPARLASTPEMVAQSERIILPGVGSFDWAMHCLERAGLRQTLDEQVLQKKIPVLGICVGMQMMAKISEEGSEPGLGWIDAEVKQLATATNTRRLILPHMGWNDVKSVESSDLFTGLHSDARFYFLHTYYFATHDNANVIATTTYGDTFACGVKSDNCYGVQFHPEKSHKWGVSLLKNFAEV